MISVKTKQRLVLRELQHRHLHLPLAFLDMFKIHFLELAQIMLRVCVYVSDLVLRAYGIS